MAEIQGNKILIAGFGREGKSTLAFLQKNYPGLTITIADKNPDAVKNVPGVQTFAGENYLDGIATFDTVVKSPGIPPNEVFKKAKHLTSHTNLFFEHCPGQVVGITGTKGKSTTSSLLAHILTHCGRNARLIGNVGHPALSFIDGATKNTIFVMELSSYQLMDIHTSPHVAVLLPIYEEHLNYHGNMQNYVAAKAKITQYQTEADYLLYYSQNSFCRQIAESSAAQKISFDSLSAKSALLGEANKINISAAYHAALLFADDKKKILSAIQSFKPLPHRLENIGEYNEIVFVNDSLATIPEATIHALEALEGQAETLIAGGFDRGIDFTKLGEAISSSTVKNLILFPDTGAKIESALKKAEPHHKINIFKTDSINEAVALCFDKTAKGKVCLLSPASTSFNLFKDYEERGNAFKSAVVNYASDLAK